MKLVISIVSWNTAELLRQCLQSLRPFCRPNHTRVVVIDNASSDDTPSMVRSEFPEVTLIESGGNLGFGRAHNLIAHHSDEPYVLFLNPDTEFLENAHERMLEAFQQNSRIGAASCMLVDSDGTINPLGIQWYPSPGTELIAQLFLSSATLKVFGRFLPRHDPAKVGLVKKLYGGCLMVRRDVLDQVGWFDERFFMYGEDVDLSRRIHEAGYHLCHVGTTRVIHTGAGASSKAPGQFAVLMQYESIAKLMRKNYGRIGRLAYHAIAGMRALLRIVALAMARMVLTLARKGSRDRLVGSWRKQVAILRWSVGLARPAIPK